MSSMVAAALLLLMAMTPAGAEVAYVTDQLRLGVHKNSDTSDKPFTNI